MVSASRAVIALLGLLAACGGSAGHTTPGDAGAGIDGARDAGTPPAPGAPQLAYTDLVTGSGSGGDNGNGAYVTVWGVHLAGTTAITVGGQPAVLSCARCSITETRITFQLGAAAATGNLVVTTAMGTSNALPFTVIPTDYYFISPTGSDTAAGTFAAPYATLRHFLDTRAPITRNTVVYLMDGLTLIGDDGRGFHAAAAVDSGGVDAANRLNLVAYPGATVTIGSPNAAAEFGMVTYSDYVTIAGLRLRGYSAFNGYPSTGYLRFIGNDVSCQQVPAAFGDNACLEFASGDSAGGPATDTAFLGNTVHDTGGPTADKTYHAVYFSTDMDDSEIGWNTIGTGTFYGYCRSILLHSSPNGNPGSGKNQYGYQIHDNYIVKGWCDAIGLSSVDPSKGAIDVFNNVIANTGVSSDGSMVAPPDGNNAGIQINADDQGASAGVVHIYNNTIYAAGVYAAYHSNGCVGVLATGATAELDNNVCDQRAVDQPYIETAAGGEVANAITGGHNLWFGNGAAPAFDATALTVDPKLAATIDLASVASFTVGLTTTPPVGAPIVDGIP